MKAPLLQQRVESGGPIAGNVGALPNSDAQQMGQALDSGLAALIKTGGAEQRQADAEYQQKAHEAAVSLARDSLTSYGNQTTDTLYGATPTTAPETGDQPGNDQVPGFLSTQGMQAAHLSTDTLKNLETKRQGIADSLTDPKAKQLFLQQSADMYSQSRKTVEDHVTRQIEVAKTDSLNAATDEAVRASSVDPNNDALARQRIADAVGAAHAFGRDDSWNKSKEMEVQQKVSVARVSSLLDSGDWRGADRVLNDNKYALGEHAAPLEKAIRVASGVSEADDTVTGILKGARQENGFVDQAKAIADFEALPGDKRTKDAEAAFTHRLELASKQETAMKSGKFDGALSAYLGKHNINDVPAVTKSWLLENDPKGWHALEQVVHADRERARGAPPTDEQRRAYAAFDVDLHDNPDKFATMSLQEFNRSYWPNLAPTDREKAAQQFAAAHGQAAKPGTLTKEESDMLLEAGRTQGLFGPKDKDVSTWNDDQAQLHYAASETLTKKVTQYRKMNGKPPPFEQVKAWTDELMQSGKIPGSGYFGTDIGAGHTRLEAIQKGKENEFQPKWGDAEIADQAKRLQRVGLPATPENIDTALRRRHGLPAAPIAAPTPGAPDPNAPPTDGKNAADWGLDLSEGTPDIGLGD